MSTTGSSNSASTRPIFVAALDQSGGSTPKAFALYGIHSNACSNDEEMFAIVHEMRTRIVDQQFDVARQIIAGGLVAIIEPEVDTHCSEKAKA